MAVTKIKCRTSGTDKAIQYILNGDKTRGQILTARLNCDPGYEYRQMKDTKEYFDKTDGRQCYHIIISYKPGEVTPELALQIAEEFARENLSDYEVVMAVHTDKRHIHSHIVFNSVSLKGEKYHLGRGDYYRKIRAFFQLYIFHFIIVAELDRVIDHAFQVRIRKEFSSFFHQAEASTGKLF